MGLSHESSINSERQRTIDALNRGMGVLKKQHEDNREMVTNLQMNLEKCHKALHIATECSANRMTELSQKVQHIAELKGRENAALKQSAEWKEKCLRYQQQLEHSKRVCEAKEQ